MNKIAFIDLDGVIVNSSARFAKAEEAKVVYLTDKGLLAKIDASTDQFDKVKVKADVIEWAATKINSGVVPWRDDVYVLEDMKQADNAYWRTAFTPELVRLDTLIDGVLVDLDSLISAQYRIILLTSRPESMRQATSQWLSQFGIDIAVFMDDFGYPLLMKPASQQYVKTVVWKSGIVETLVRLLNDDDEFLFVDDEPAMREAIAALDLPCGCKIGESLVEALAMLEEK